MPQIAPMKVEPDNFEGYKARVMALLGERYAGAKDRSAEDVAAKLVGSQQVVHRAPRDGVTQVLLDRVVRRQDRRQHRDQGQEDDPADRQHQARPAASTALPGEGCGDLPGARGPALVLDDVRHPYLLLTV